MSEETRCGAAQLVNKEGSVAAGALYVRYYFALFLHNCNSDLSAPFALVSVYRPSLMITKSFFYRRHSLFTAQHSVRLPSLRNVRCVHFSAFMRSVRFTDQKTILRI